MYTSRNMLCAYIITISKNMKFKPQNIDTKDMGNSSIMSNMQLSKRKNKQTKNLLLKNKTFYVQRWLKL